MNNQIIGGFEDAIEKGQSAVSHAAKQAVADFGNTVKGQMGGSQTQASTDQGTNEQASAAKQQMSNDQAKQFLKDLYGPTAKKTAKVEEPDHPITEALGLPQADPNAGKTPEELAKLQGLRVQLHQDYYQGLVNPPKPEEKPVTEKLEEEKKMEELEMEKMEREQPGPLQNVKTGTGERMVGVSG